MLHFPDFLIAEYRLQAGGRLLTVNTYGRGQAVVQDIVEGPASTRRWGNCYPVIADFLSDDLDVIAHRKHSIAELEWGRAAGFAKARISGGEAVSVRDGRPLQSRYPGKPFRIS